MKRNHVMYFVSVGMMVVFTISACGLPSLPGPSTASLPPPRPSTSTTAPERSPVAIQHLVQPGAGVTAIANAHDNEESRTVAEKTIRGGDDFGINRFER